MRRVDQKESDFVVLVINWPEQGQSKQHHALRKRDSSVESSESEKTSETAKPTKYFTLQIHVNRGENKRVRQPDPDLIISATVAKATDPNKVAFE